jgi:hypothetical protein
MDDDHRQGHFGLLMLVRKNIPKLQSEANPELANCLRLRAGRSIVNHSA